MEVSEKEQEYEEVLLKHAIRKLQRYVTDEEVPFKDRLVVYLATPKKYFTSLGAIPGFFEWVEKHGDINWQQDFPFLLRDQSVNLVKFCQHAMQGNYTYFPEHWSTDMINDFIVCCVNRGIHEFDFYW